METIVMQNFWGKQGALWSTWKWWMPESFLEINRYFALTSYYNTIGQSNNKESVFWSLHPLANKTTVTNSMGNSVTRFFCPFFLQSTHFQSRGRRICAALWRYVCNSPSGQNIVNVSCQQWTVITGTQNGPKRNWKQWLCKIWGWQTKSIMVWYGIFWSGQVHSLLKIYKSPNRPTNTYFVSESCPGLYIVAEQGKGSDLPYF